MDTAYKYGLLFGGEAVSESEKARVTEEIAKVAPGGSLSFAIEKNADGWSAQCNEVPAIIAGNTNPNPSDIELQSEIRSAIFATFEVQVEQADMKSPYEENFRYTAVQ